MGGRYDVRAKLEARVAARAELEVEVHCSQGPVTASSLCCSRSLVDTNGWMDMLVWRVGICLHSGRELPFHLHNHTVRYFSVLDNKKRGRRR